MLKNNMPGIITSLVLLVLLPGAGVAANESRSADAHRTPVTVTTVGTRDLAIWQFSEGHVEAINSPMVAAEVGGRVIAVSADVGQAVHSGQVLAKIDPVDFRLAKALVNADISRLNSLIVAQELQVKRLQTLVKKKSANQSSLDEAQAQLGALKAQLSGAKVRLQQAERKLNKSRIVSPLDGRVDERRISEGDYVKVGTPMFHLSMLKQLRVWLPFPESLGPQLKRGQVVELSTPVAPGQKVQASISHIRPEITATSRAINVLVDLDNPGDWQPGASVTGRVRTALHENALVVDEGCVIRRPAGLVVYRIRNGKAEEVPVTAGVHQGGMIEILSGVQAGEQLALDGAGYLTDGVAVDVKGAAQPDLAQ